MFIHFNRLYLAPDNGGAGGAGGGAAPQTAPPPAENPQASDKSNEGAGDGSQDPVFNFGDWIKTPENYSAVVELGEKTFAKGLKDNNQKLIGEKEVLQSSLAEKQRELDAYRTKNPEATTPPPPTGDPPTQQIDPLTKYTEEEHRILLAEKRQEWDINQKEKDDLRSEKDIARQNDFNQANAETSFRHELQRQGCKSDKMDYLLFKIQKPFSNDKPKFKTTFYNGVNK